MTPNNLISRAEAQQLVHRIARGYGWISQRARDASDQEALDAIDMLQESLGIAVRTYASCQVLVFWAIFNNVID